ncbi:MAG: metallophosphoesterase, partial [Oscillospiraceae bacterium]|nr:metallophosphoesterase [Oscillospiraceae bacterium]
MKIISKIMLCLLMFCLLFSVASCAEAPGADIIDYSLLILSTNDIHGHFDDLARYSSLVKQLREENHEVLLLDAGDLFRRGPYESWHGEIEIEILNAIGYNAMALGNNDFKVPGMDGDPYTPGGSLEQSGRQIADLVEWANFPILCGNVKMKETGKYMSGI